MIKKKLVIELPIEGNDLGLSELERFIAEATGPANTGVVIETHSYVDDEQASIDGVARVYGVSGEHFTATIVEYEEPDEE